MKGANGDFRPEPAAVATSALVNGGSGQHRRRPDSKSLTLRVIKGAAGDGIVSPVVSDLRRYGVSTNGGLPTL
jgi:hypothetical protein